MEKYQTGNNCDALRDRAIRELEEIDKIGYVDLSEFEKKYCWRYIFNNLSDSSGCLYMVLKGIKVEIDGDISKIVIRGKDHMTLHVIYSVNKDDHSYKSATIHVNSEGLKKWIRENARPNTRVKLIASYNGNVNEYDLIAIKRVSSKMKFGHYICPKCKDDYGMTLWEDNHCLICECELEYIDDFYREGEMFFG